MRFWAGWPNDPLPAHPTRRCGRSCRDLLEPAERVLTGSLVSLSGGWRLILCGLSRVLRWWKFQPFYPFQSNPERDSRQHLSVYQHVDPVKPLLLDVYQHLDIDVYPMLSAGKDGRNLVTQRDYFPRRCVHADCQAVFALRLTGFENYRKEDRKEPATAGRRRELGYETIDHANVALHPVLLCEHALTQERRDQRPCALAHRALFVRRRRVSRLAGTSLRGTATSFVVRSLNA